ncbi:MAG: hypothetical protein M3347_11040 [Armatimonadota bacterium]|nr:hypothetical protein [Armatimonadota bacterium]
MSWATSWSRRVVDAEPADQLGNYGLKLKSKQEVPSLTHPVLALNVPAKGQVMAIAFAPDGHSFATATDGNTITLRSAQTGRQLRAFIEASSTARSPTIFPDGQRVYSLNFSPDGATLASAGNLIKNDRLVGGEVRLWDARSGQLLRTITVNKEPGTFTYSVVFTPDGKALVTGMTKYGRTARAANKRGEISIWDVKTGVLQQRWKTLTIGVDSVAFSPDGHTLATGCGDATVKLWDWKSGNLRRTLQGTFYRVFSLCFAPDGKWLASCIGPDLPGIAGNLEQLKTVHLWNLHTGQTELMAIKHSGLVTAIAFSPDGEHLMTGDDGGAFSGKGVSATLKLWRFKSSISSAPAPAD